MPASLLHETNEPPAPPTSSAPSLTSLYLRLALATVRLPLLAGMGYSFLFKSHHALHLYWLCFILDIFSRPVASFTSSAESSHTIEHSLTERIHQLGVLGDRINVAVLYLSTLLATTSVTSDVIAFVLLVAPVLLEVGSLSLQAPDHQTQPHSHHQIRSSSSSSSPSSLSSVLLYDLLRGKSPLLVTAVGLGSELFLLLIWET